MKYGTGAPGQVGWAVDFLEILLTVVWIGFYFSKGPPPQKHIGMVC